MKARAIVPLAIAAAAAGCGALEPYPTTPRLAAAGAHDAGLRVAICYDPIVSKAAAVRREAQQQCAADTVATRVDTDFLLLNCPVLLPGRATFVCAPKPKT